MQMSSHPDYTYAFHEAGHAIVAHELGLKMESVSINGENSVLTTILPSEDLNLSEWHAYMEKECICLGGGYAADLIQFEWIQDSWERDIATMRGSCRDKYGVEEHWPHQYEKTFQHFKKKNSASSIPIEIHKWDITWDEAVKRARDILDPRRKQLEDLASKFCLHQGEIKGEEIHKWLR